MTSPQDSDPNVRRFSDYIADDGVDGLLLDYSAGLNKELPQTVKAYAERRQLGTISVDPMVMFELIALEADREHSNQQRHQQ